MTKKPKSGPEPAGHLPALDEIDLGAALPVKPKRGRPRSTTPKPPPRNPKRKVRKDKGVKKGPVNKDNPKTPYIDNNILVGSNIIKEDMVNYDGIREGLEKTTKTSIKDKITEKELRFIGFYLTGENNREKAMDLAGYQDLNPRYKLYLAAKIIQKYESQAEDHRIIARALGAGEVFVIKGLMDLAKTSKSDMVRRAALADLAKILGLTKEQLEGAGGITIIFEGSGTPASLPGAPPPAALPATPAALPGPASMKPIMVTK